MHKLRFLAAFLLGFSIVNNIIFALSITGENKFYTIGYIVAVMIVILSILLFIYSMKDKSKK